MLQYADHHVKDKKFKCMGWKLGNISKTLCLCIDIEWLEDLEVQDIVIKICESYIYLVVKMTRKGKCVENEKSNLDT